jgi:hypothetical protein
VERAYFGNCIIYGNLQNEVFIDKYPSDQGVLNYQFENCLFKFNQEGIDTTDPSHFTDNINNEDPKFVSWREYNFHLDSISPAINKGSLAIAEKFRLDLDMQDRTLDRQPDIGAYEWIPKGE